MEIDVSVVVPVYNVEDYLVRCLESIVSQDLRPLEIILVDDGSTDSSGDLCDQLCQKMKMQDEKLYIKVIHKENEGLTKAWKTGCQEASGEYVGFVDSDDYILPDMYTTLLKKVQETGADIACCGIRHVFEEGNHKEWNDEMQFPKNFYTAEEMRTEVYPVFINNGKFMGRGLQPNRVSKLLRRSLILKNMQLCNDEVTVGEDYQFSLSMFLDAEKIVIIPDYFPYFYYMHKKSMTGVFQPEYLDKIKKMKNNLIRISDYFGGYDFNNQIQNDFLCLAVLHVKEAAVRNKVSGFKVARNHMERICIDQEVVNALQRHTMDGLTLSEKLFVFFMKRRLYFPAYIAVNLYFRES